MSDFRPCSSCRTRSQASLCHCTRGTISNRAEDTLERLRYSLGGDRPSQTTRLTLSSSPSRQQVRIIVNQEWYLNDRSTEAKAPASKRPTYAAHEDRLPNGKL